MIPGLRDSRSGDETIVLDLVETVLAEYGLKANPRATDRDLSDIKAAYHDRGGVFRILEADDGRLIGSYGLYRISEDVCELRKMYLLPEYHGQGHGRKMMLDAFAQAKLLGFDEMVLETNSVLQNARKLYEKCGFRSYRPSHLSDRCDSAMRKSL
ncbi:MAG: GNAT family N-acetyltransferase [Planctomycetes bacterium]|nr:GNAT family N-acetyltransferase [Planctomycetota bacterium]